MRSSEKPVTGGEICTSPWFQSTGGPAWAEGMEESMWEFTE